MTYTVEHRPDGYACNMGWVVVNADGKVCHRGPEWSCNVRVHAWTTGRGSVMTVAMVPPPA